MMLASLLSALLLTLSALAMNVPSTDKPDAGALRGVSPTLCSASVKGGAVLAGLCSRRGDLRCGIKSGHYEYCNGNSWLTMCPCRPEEKQLVSSANSIGTRQNPGRSCNEILLGGGSHGDGVYWVTPADSLPYAVYCDMTTAGGGWTLVVKVKGNDHIMNRLNTAQWRDGRLIGHPTTLLDENAMGVAYTNMPFHDVMIRALQDGENKHVAWRHSVKHESIQKIVQNCETMNDGYKISGDISSLSFNGDPNYHKPCTELVYGFLGGAWKGVSPTVAGCSTGRSTYMGVVVGAFLDPPSGDRTRVGQSKNCISVFGMGSGYYKLQTTDDKYALNAHWWSKGNDVTHNWNTHALFVR
ncbi:uncharacterized protein [Oscarella lobularis]|uniref:uncharacterized protein n=1 Tax=Oscarella lobularis TaxID=121494 RepID=UPI003313F92A